ncbi:MAG: D-glycero-beta-D-manno-heptose-7-phosphate kinase [Candidatus Latescibacterota bacterium]
MDKREKLLTEKEAERILSRFGEMTVLVVGDLMLDKYIRGHVDRISPEAPVPVIRVASESFSPGGAANVATNLCALGAKALVVGRVGEDAEGEMLSELLRKESADVSGIVRDRMLPTVLKTRIIAHHQHVVRVDREATGAMAGSVLEEALCRIEAHLPNVSGVVVSDYGKGVITPQLMQKIVSMARSHGKPLVLDPKSRDFGMYRGARCITPNQKEAGEACDMAIETESDLVTCGRRILDQVEAECVLITRGEGGMSVFERGGAVTHIPTHAQEVYDVSGAGDTVMGTFSLAICAGASWKAAAYLSNLAAGVVVGKVGTATASREEILFRLAEIAGV